MHQTQQANPLLDAIDDLTIVHIISTPIDDGKTHYEKHDGLIKQLREAIVSDLGGSAGGKPPNERIPLDADALQKYEQIEKAIGERYVALLEKVPGLYPENNLREWYQEFANQHRSGNLSDETYDDEVKTMKSWVRIISEKLSPPTVRELVGNECPKCGFDWYIDIVNLKPLDTERRVALTVTYRPDDKGGLMSSFVKCGCCNEVWMGSTGIRELAYEIECKPAIEETEVS